MDDTHAACTASVQEKLWIWGLPEILKSYLWGAERSAGPTLPQISTIKSPLVSYHTSALASDSHL